MVLLLYWYIYLVLIIDILTVWILISLIKILSVEEVMEWGDEVMPLYKYNLITMKSSFNKYLALSEPDFPSHYMIIMGKINNLVYL